MKLKSIVIVLISVIFGHLIAVYALKRKDKLCFYKQEAIVKDTIALSKSDYIELQSLTQPARDVAIYFMLNEDKQELDGYIFSCGKYEIWISNGYEYLEIWKPVKYQLNKKEKDYFWKMYTKYQREDLRFYKYETEVEIVLEPQVPENLDHNQSSNYEGI